MSIYTDLSIHREEIKVVPGFDNFSIFDPGEDHAGKVDRRIAGSYAKMIASVLTSNSAAHRHHVSLSNYVFYCDVDIGKRPAKQGVKGHEV